MYGTVMPPNSMTNDPIHEEFIDKIAQLPRGSESRDTDINNYINFITKEYFDSYRLYRLPKNHFRRIVAQLTKQELSELARDISKNDILKICLMLNDKSRDTLPLRVAKIWLNMSAIHHRYEIATNNCRITIEHEMGFKYSYLLKEISRYIFEVAFETNSIFDIYDSTFLLTLEFFGSSSVINDIQQLEIADGLKELLVEAGFTIELITLYGSQKISEILNIDNFVGKLIVEAAQNSIGQRGLSF
jgi:hypothetical protein